MADFTLDGAQERSPELEEELRLLSPTQKTALLMMLLGEDEAANILTHLEPREVQHLGAAMVSVSEISQEAVSAVLDEFIATIKHQTSLGFGTSDYVENVLVKALGEDKASSVMGRIMPRKSSSGLEILRWMDARSISEMIRNEHPQIIAIILAFLDYSLAADVLNYLAPDIRAEVIMRVANLETIQPEALDELEIIMKQQFANNSAVKSSSVGGVKAAAKIMNYTKADLETAVMGTLEDVDGDLAQRIQDNMFVFDNLADVDNKSIQVLMRNIEPDQLMTALKGADEEVKDKFLENMSKRAAEMFLDDMEAKGPIRITEAEEAQKQILRKARKLSDAGELMLSGRGDDFV
ncbi:Flagellar motor switch protein FliG [Marinobacterium sp. xm-d-420]|jgi:flagellar motor switch protein FliG|uniref:flagellar motor switch protein FliG n=1 Tax=Marinobacterium sp. xm-d-420 TaxID=2497737 RepID=UPI001568FFDC|nr:flagellar motor switch protein FliG [Marinobacterium sp. xm-d-420]NRP28679.1 Flagellar motor switch protein FliG [Marinobacterium sp. xm-d-420]